MRNTSIPQSAEHALQRLVEFESRVTVIELDSEVTVHISPCKKELVVAHQGMRCRGYLDVKLAHQLGSKVWKNCDKNEIFRRWRNHPTQILAILLQATLSFSGYRLRAYPSNGEMKIYGLTTDQFLPVDQKYFRSELVSKLGEFGIQPNGQVSHTKFGEITESFSVPGSDHQVGLRCSVIYGLNNGYSSYRLNWGRYVLICSNGLTDFKQVGKGRWIHTRETSVSDFVAQSVTSATTHLSEVEKQITEARNRSLDFAVMDQFMSRLTIANATRERLVGRLRTEFRDTGENEWSVSQALTNLGEHEKAIPFRVRSNFTLLGSRLLNEDLASLSSETSNLTQDGYLGIFR